MRNKIYLIIVLLLCGSLLAFALMIMFPSHSSHRNRLGEEKSPYLLQHKDNPVWWYAWGEEAFEAAKKENKPIFLSIGYSTCHWCHVMEKESFEDHEVSGLLNKYFISIKVDREERPDVDKIYMDALVATSGQGGWPMSMFLDHELKPFYGGTYFPKSSFLQLLNGIFHAWQKDFEKIQKTAKDIGEYLTSQARSLPSQTPLTEKALGLLFKEAERIFDSHSGGFGHAPKFPPSVKLQVLLRVAHRVKDDNHRKQALHMVETTLEHMARGGIYDHLGGGFHRYSTDSEWLTPHFEKMLYDNASLSLVYLEAYQLTKKILFKEVARETLDYVVRDMTHPEGGFYSAQDADSEGVEGKFYVWTEEELKKYLTSQEFEPFKKIYGITSGGNFEHGDNILTLQKEYTWGVKKEPLIQGAIQKLFSIREKRIHPYKDDKILTDWNGLMIASLAKGYQILRDEKYLKAAQRAAQFIQKNLLKEIPRLRLGSGQLLKRYRDGEAKFSATLDDYAYLISGLLTLYESDFNIQWVEWAKELQNIQDQLFWDEKGFGYFFTASGESHLIRRSKEFHDEARPNSNGVSMLNLLKLFGYTFDVQYKDKAEKMILIFSQGVIKNPSAHAQVLLALDYALDHSKEIVIIGKKEDPLAQQILSYLWEEFLPNKVLVFSTEKDTQKLPLTNYKTMIKNQATAYVCENNRCKQPSSDLSIIKNQLTAFKIYSIE